MSTKNTTQTTNAYNPASMSAYNAFQPQLASYWMQSLQNPLGSSFFKNQLAQSNSMVNQLNQNAMTNATRNLRAGGGILSNSGGFSSALINRNAIAGNLMKSNAFNNALNNAMNTRNVASASMAAYQPLQTGQTSTQTQSGLGTWLPQVAGMAAGALMPGLGSMMGGGSFSGGYQANPFSAPRANTVSGFGGGAFGAPPPSWQQAPSNMFGQWSGTPSFGG